MSLDLNRIQALCFDVDGTLSDTDDLYTRKIVHFLPRLLFKDPNHTARRLVMWVEAPGNVLLSFADRIGMDDKMVAFINWFYRHGKQPTMEFQLVPGVDEMLRELHNHYPMAVVSAREEQSTMAFLEQFNLVKYFDIIVTGLSTKRTKPYPDPVLFAAKKMNTAPENCLMIGDTTVDMRAGKSAGAQTAGVLCGFGEEFELRKMGANMILKDTPMLLELLINRRSPLK